MKYLVVKEFTTPLHRFQLGMEVDAADIDGPVPTDQYVAAGFLEPMVPLEEPEAPAENIEKN